MAEKFTIKAEKRDTRGKNEARRMRAGGKVPVVIYGGGGESVSASAALADLAAVLRSDGGVNSVFSFDIDGAGSMDVIFQDRQIDPVKGRLIHADLRRLVKGEKIEMTVAILFDGEPLGVKEDGGMLEQSMREVKVLCEPANAPEGIHVDVSQMRVGDSLHISDLKVDEGVEIHGDPGTVIAHVIMVKEPELEPQVEEGVEPTVEGEEAAAEGAPEPEGGVAVLSWLVVGLGNPGPEYAKTRHNLGFMLVDVLATRLQTTVKREECRALIGRGVIDNQTVELAKPQTFMNLSGEAVNGLLAKEGRNVERLIVISDDLAIPFGTIRVRPRGSHGGQNGLRSIIDCLRTQDFIRVRIGIEPEHPIADASRFVLENFAKGDAETVGKVLEEAADAVETIIREGVEAAMQIFN